MTGQSRQKKTRQINKLKRLLKCQLLDLLESSTFGVCLRLFLERAAVRHLRWGQPAAHLPEVVWRLTLVSQPSLQLLARTESHCGCQLLFLLSAPVVLIHRTAAAAAAPRWALTKQRKNITDTKTAAVAATSSLNFDRLQCTIDVV